MRKKKAFLTSSGTLFGLKGTKSLTLRGLSPHLSPEGLLSRPSDLARSETGQSKCAT
jgi:hypothetical protein